VELEADVRYRERAAAGVPGTGCLLGTTPLLLSAPHSAVHTRVGEPKEEEEYTAALACLVAELTEAHALYVRRRSPTDPNWYKDVPYKRQLKRMVVEAGIRFVLDIHGSAPHRHFGIALGTMKGESCPDHRDTIIRLLEEHGFRRHADSLDYLDVDNRFTAGGLAGQETVTSFAWRGLGVPSAQLELHPSLRVVERREDATLPGPFHGDSERIECVVQALVHLVSSLSSEEAREWRIHDA
jgi:hypothetical protein